MIKALYNGYFSELETFSERTSIWSASETYLLMPKEVCDALFGPGSPRYLQEVIL